jgi:hypothetical protein
MSLNLYNLIYFSPIPTPEFGWEYNLNITSPRQMDWTLLNGQYKYPLALFFFNDTFSTGDSESVVSFITILLNKCQKYNFRFIARTMCDFAYKESHNSTTDSDSCSIHQAFQWLCP